MYGYFESSNQTTPITVLLNTTISLKSFVMTFSLFFFLLRFSIQITYNYFFRAEISLEESLKELEALSLSTSKKTAPKQQTKGDIESSLQELDLLLAKQQNNATKQPVVSSSAKTTQTKDNGLNAALNDLDILAAQHGVKESPKPKVPVTIPKEDQEERRIKEEIAERKRREANEKREILRRNQEELEKQRYNEDLLRKQHEKDMEKKRNAIDSLNQLSMELGGGSAQTQNGNKPICCKCGRPILSKCLTVDKNFYHPECLTCCKCHKPIKEFYRVWGGLCCRGCAGGCGEACGGCGLPVLGVGVDALDTRWHSECFKCSYCLKKLGSNFVVFKDKPYCSADCVKRVQHKLCATCNRPITGLSVTIDGKSYHNTKECFHCKMCKCGFPDREYCLVKGEFYCPKCATLASL